MSLNRLETEAVAVVRRRLCLPEGTAEVDEESLRNAGFCSSLKAVRLDRSVDLVLKTAPASKELRSVIPFEEIFAREVYVYETVLPVFGKLQRVDAVPRCFHCSKEPFGEVLVLENLKTQGYRLWPRAAPMDLAHLKLVLEEYAGWHALSFVLRAQQPKVLEEIERSTDDIYLPIVKKCGTAETIRQLSGRFWKTSVDIIEVMERSVAKGVAGECAVLCHGDAWCNNILFKYQDDRPTHLKLLDWQLSRFGSPALDLSYFLCCSAPPSALRDVDALLLHYHRVLDAALRRFDLSASALFPPRALADHWRRFALFGLGMAFLVVNVMTMEEAELPDVNGNGEGGGDFVGAFARRSENDGRYAERMEGIVGCFREWGLV